MGGGKGASVGLGAGRDEALAVVAEAICTVAGSTIGRRVMACGAVKEALVRMGRVAGSDATRAGVCNAIHTLSGGDDGAGEVGEAAGFSILKSNNVPNTTGEKYKILAGHSIATSYVEQIVDVQTYKPEKRFGDAVKGLHVYGGKVVRPTALAMLIANKA